MSVKKKRNKVVAAVAGAIRKKIKKRYIPHPKHVPFEYNQITNYIYLGTNQCCQVHFDSLLLKKGVEATISLEKGNLPSPIGVTYFLWLPVADKKPPAQKQLLTGARTIKNFVDNNIKVYVHCKRGHGRSPTLVAAYFILEGMKTVDAIRKIRSRRNIHMTASQIKALKLFEKSLIEKKVK